MKLPINGPLTVVVLSWGFNFVAVKELYHEMSAPAVALIRWAVMYAILVLICVVTKKSLLPAPGDRLRVLGIGFVAMGVYMVLFMEGMRGTTSAEGAIVLATSPIFVYLFSCLKRHEPFSGSALVGAVVAFLGVALVILGGPATGHGSLSGNLTILLSATLWALGAVMMKPLLGRYEPTQVLTMSMPGALPVLIPYGISASIHTHFAEISVRGWLMFASVAIMSGVVAFACFYAGVRKIGTSGAAMYQYFVPPMAVFFAWLIQGKSPGLVQFVGLGIVLAGVAYAGRARAMAKRLAPVTA